MLNYLQNDPLTDLQRGQIKAFADRCLLTDVGTNKATRPATQASRHKLRDVWYNCKEELRKTYTPANSDALRQARQALGDESFTALRAALKDPAPQFSTIDAHNPAQVFAARKYLKAILRSRPEHYHDLESMELGYAWKMASQEFGRDISAKNCLLMRGDPLQAIDPSQTQPGVLDLIYANTHFEVPGMDQTQTTTYPNGRIEVISTHYGPTREQARAIMKEQIRHIYDDPRTQHVLCALAALIRREKANIFFSRSPNGVGALGRERRIDSSIPGGTVGFSHKHSIYNAATINPYDSKPVRENVGTFVHETLHLLFKHVVHADSSPTRHGSAEEAELDAALEADRRHRATLAPQFFSAGERSCYRTMVSQLERERSYFGEGFQPDNPEHRKTMRVEAIVRPVEQLAQGVHPAALEKIMPNLWRFYQKHAQPLLEAYAAQALPENQY